MVTKTQPVIDLTAEAIALLHLLGKAATTGIQATSLVPSAMGDDYDSLIAANLIEVRCIAIREGRFSGQELPYVFIRPTGVALLHKLESNER
jgi:hypothetical protein